MIMPRTRAQRRNITNELFNYPFLQYEFTIIKLGCSSRRYDFSFMFFFLILFLSSFKSQVRSWLAVDENRRRFLQTASANNVQKTKEQTVTNGLTQAIKSTVPNDPNRISVPYEYSYIYISFFFSFSFFFLNFRMMMSRILEKNYHSYFLHTH